jgi:hypothetical protein
MLGTSLALGDLSLTMEAHTALGQSSAGTQLFFGKSAYTGHAASPPIETNCNMQHYSSNYRGGYRV